MCVCVCVRGRNGWLDGKLCASSARLAENATDAGSRLHRADLRGSTLNLEGGFVLPSVGGPYLAASRVSWTNRFT
jgi:hypothetical protein